MRSLRYSPAGWRSQLSGTKLPLGEVDGREEGRPPATPGCGSLSAEVRTWRSEETEVQWFGSLRGTAGSHAQAVTPAVSLSLLSSMLAPVWSRLSPPGGKRLPRRWTTSRRPWRFQQIAAVSDRSSPDLGIESHRLSPGESGSPSAVVTVLLHFIPWNRGLEGRSQ